MKNQFRIVLRVSAVVALSALLCAPWAAASDWPMKTKFTINQPVLIPGKVVLPAGSYVIKRLDAPATPHLVRIMDPTETKVYATLFGVPEYLTRPADEPRLTFNETPEGTLRSLRGWYAGGSGVGIEFPGANTKSEELLAQSN